MAAPTWVQSSALSVRTTGTPFNTGSLASVTIGNVIIIQILLDGTGDLMSIADTNSTIEALDGTDNTMTIIDGGGGSGDAFNVGSPTAALQHLWIGRALATSVNADIDMNTGDDCYTVIHEFTSVSAGTTLATVIENSTAGSFTNGVGTAAQVDDTSVTTLGSDRLALNLIGVNDDNQASFASFTGETGGDWVQRVALGSATGTDGAVGLQTAAMASAGTINGGSFTMAASDSWGVVGFALIGTTVDAPVPRNPAINHQNPAVLAKEWVRGKAGVWLPPKLWTPSRPKLVLV